MCGLYLTLFPFPRAEAFEKLPRLLPATYRLALSSSRVYLLVERTIVLLLLGRREVFVVDIYTFASSLSSKQYTDVYGKGKSFKVLFCLLGFHSYPFIVSVDSRFLEESTTRIRIRTKRRSVRC